MGTDKQNDREFDDYLKGDSELSRSYRNSTRPDPPKHLDDIILAAAKNELDKTANNVFRLVPRTWYRPISRVALLVICVGLLFTLYEMEQQSAPLSPGMEVIPDTEPLIKKESDTTATATADEAFMQDKAGKSVNGETVPGLPQSAAPSLDSESIEKRLIQLDDVLTEPVEIQDQKTGQSEPTTLPEKKQPAPEREAPASMLRREAQLEDAMTAAGDSAFGTVMTEEEWLNNISALWQSGDTEEAVKRLKKFLEYYPDYPEVDIIKHLPDDFDFQGFAELNSVQ